LLDLFLNSGKIKTEKRVEGKTKRENKNKNYFLNYRRENYA